MTASPSGPVGTVVGTPGNTALGIVIGTLCVLGAAAVLVSAIAMVRERDAYGRINVLGPATSLGLPLIVFAGWLNRVVETGFDAVALGKLVVTVGALWGVSSVGSMTLARAAYVAGTPVHPDTHPQDLAEEPEIGMGPGTGTPDHVEHPGRYHRRHDEDHHHEHDEGERG